MHLVGARVGDLLVGVAGLEVQGEGLGELKRFFVQPEHRGTGVADALMAALLEWGAGRAQESLGACVVAALTQLGPAGGLAGRSASAEREGS